MSYHEVGNSSAIVTNSNLSCKVWYFVLAGTNTQCRKSIYISCYGRLDSIGNKYELYRIDNRYISADINESPCTFDGIGTSCGNHTAIGVCKSEVVNIAAIVGECSRYRMCNSSVGCKCASIGLVNRDCRWYGISRRILVLTAYAHCWSRSNSVVTFVLDCVCTCYCPAAVVGKSICINRCYSNWTAICEQICNLFIAIKSRNIGICKTVVLVRNIFWPCTSKFRLSQVLTADTHRWLGSTCYIVDIIASICNCICT